MFTNFDEMPVTLSVEQAAEVLSIAPVSLYKLIKKRQHLSYNEYRKAHSNSEGCSKKMD